MRVLVTGCNGYIGSVLTPMLLAEGHAVLGIDSDLYEDCAFAARAAEAGYYKVDVRDVRAADLRGFDAVIHLAALSNDPLGDLDPALTYEINHLATVRLAKMARQVGVERFLFSSSCSTYGSAGDDPVSEDAEFHPCTPYGRSKVLAECDLSLLADDDFSPVFLRNATAYGFSPRLRLDLVVNDFVAAAFTAGVIRLRSDGTAWRPLVHVEDICRAFLAALRAPRAAIHNQAFNVGRNEENYRVNEVAAIVAETAGCGIEYAAGASPDQRCYRVDCSKIARQLPGFRPRWTVARGVGQLFDAYREHGLTADDLTGATYFRLRTLRSLIADGRVTGDLRWRPMGLRYIDETAVGWAERSES
ncbi:MAG TPA: SDR family oxidoreductase, partial [Pirellulales bacterium]|nr:SDR family oxidoreductase [Pirellulales bacterium]